MTRRFPLWATLIPLGIGLAAYGLNWRLQRDEFRSDVASVLGSGHALRMSGFPYRLEADAGAVDLRRDRADSFLSLRAEQVDLHRQPWRRSLTIATARNPKLQMTAPGIAAARLDVEAKQGKASLHLEDGRVARLSAVFEDALLWLPLLPQPLDAKSFELHVRQVPPAEQTGIARTDQLQARLAGEVRASSKGDPVQLGVDIGVSADVPLTSVAAWRRGGRIALRTLTLTDAGGFLFATLDAALQARPDGRVMLAGTLQTSCPETLRTLFAGGIGRSGEFRSRRPLRFRLEGEAGKRVTLTPLDATRGGPARSREPACPVLHR